MAAREGDSAQQIHDLMGSGDGVGINIVGAKPAVQQLGLELLMAGREGVSARSIHWGVGINDTGEAKPAVQQNPKLLMAAREGDWKRLSCLLGNGDGVVISIEEEGDTTMDIAIGMSAETITFGLELDTILHVVASSGDSDNFLESASVIHSKAKHLLDAGNNNDDTPLHCAARAGSIKMVSQLIRLARAEHGGDARVKAVLRKQNKQGETALHEVLRLADKKMVKAMVDKLMATDVELARFPHANGTSPLYLAVSLGHDDIAELLYSVDKELSYSGPDGQNVLHVAVLRSKEMTNNLLKWNQGLTKQRDESTGSTPLHIAASWGSKNSKVVKLVLDADESSAFLSDSSGSFPIHVAAMRMSSSVLSVLLKKKPQCARLRDARGKTFLHIAVERERSYIVLRTCSCRRFAPILNMPDNEGNTALHLAAKAGNQWCFYPLIQNPGVLLNIMNEEGQTPLDIAWMKRPQGVIYGLEPRNRIYLLLKGAAAKNGTYRRDWFIQERVPAICVKEEEKKISAGTQIIGIGSVLIVTVAFAAAFTLPGGFRQDDHPDGGTATLAGNRVFRAFIVANTLALVCSGLATMNVMFAGVPTVDIRTRMSAFLISIAFLYCSAKSLCVAFVLGLCAVLVPVASGTAYISCAITAPFLLLDIVWFIFMVAVGEVMLLKRLGFIKWLRTFSFLRIPNIATDIYSVLRMPAISLFKDRSVSSRV